MNEVEALAHLEFMARVRPGTDGEVARWALERIDRLEANIRALVEMLDERVVAR